MTDYTEYFDEVIQAHVAIEQWLAEERDAVRTRTTADAFSPQFSMISPLGRVLDFDALNELFTAGRRQEARVSHRAQRAAWHCLA
jgi:hypothetical protein